MANIAQILTLGIAISAIAATAQGESYSWTDNSGTTHFTDDPGTIPKKFRKKISVRESIEGTPDAPPPEVTPQSSPETKAAEVNPEDRKKAIREEELQRHKKSLKSLESDVARRKDDLKLRRIESAQMPRSGPQTVRDIRQHRGQLMEINRMEEQIEATKKKIVELGGQP
ncbi:hypothetical protein OR1_02455 [Geobacter sp. OR-1]|uniref:DUF4124 domain-containing protein n=1 Tax=Geobacter sp. OR-1 TaxID=1266765 RepID=UPI000541F835|nr:DUF4124 domain-containing protein [Geobacter sp. OR-1]GAM10167.1 hypothetical protein OR1_02455 [Geobacter sp. OR-1]